MRAFFVIHESAGDQSRHRDKLPEISDHFARGGVEFELAFTSEDKSAADLAREAIAAGHENIIVGGGDGTVGMVARELVGKPVNLGILPFGTYNNIARSIQIPPTLAEACAVISDNCPLAIDVGVVNDEHYFFEAAGAGIDAELFPAGEAFKGGSWMALVDALSTAAKYEPTDVEITIDRPLAEAIPLELHSKYSPDELHQNRLCRLPFMVVVANGRYYGGGMAIAPEAHLADATLTVSIYSDFTKAELASHFVALLQGNEVDRSKIEILHASKIEVWSKSSLKVHADGNPCTETPANFAALASALRVFALPLQHSAEKEPVVS